MQTTTKWTQNLSGTLLMGPRVVPKKVLLKQKFKTVWVCMDFPFTDNEKLVIKKTKSILNFCFGKTFLGTTLRPIRRVPDRFWVHLVVVCMGLHGFFLYR